MKDFEYYLILANHDILMARNQNELKDYVASLLHEYDELQQENQQLKIQISAREEKYRKLENNWNELWDYIMQEWYCYDNDSIEYEVSKDIITKMKELRKYNN